MTTYFLVNSDFQCFDAQSHVASFRRRGVPVALIKIPGSYAFAVDESAFDAVYGFESPFNARFLATSRREVRHATARIARELPVAPGDALVVYHEMQPLNCLVAHAAHRRGGRVFMLERGISSYLANPSRSAPQWTLRAALKTLYARHVLGARELHYVKQRGPYTWPRLDEAVVKARLFYLAHRDPPPKSQIIANTYEPIDDLDEDVAMFISQPIYRYEGYATQAAYLDTVSEVCAELAGKFRKVHVKFHPKDSEEMKAALRSRLDDRVNIRWLDDARPIERTVDATRARWVYGFFSGALYALAFRGCRAVFVHERLRGRFDPVLLDEIDEFLERVGCRAEHGTKDFAPLVPPRAEVPSIADAILGRIV